MSYVSVIISGAASLGVLIGLVFGIFFLVLTGLRWVSRVREALYEEEIRRRKKILFDNAISVGSDTQDFLETRKAENGSGTSFKKKPEEKKSQSFRSKDRNALNRKENQAEEKASEKEEPNIDTIQIREFIEKTVETLIGGPLDGTTVGQISNHSAYLGMFTKYHNLLCRELARLGFALHLSVVRKQNLGLDSSKVSQCNLKELIKRIVSEAMTLPNIKEILCGPKTVKETVNDDFKNKSYEDILATAILNKVIEHFQTRENETTDAKPKPRPRTKILNKSPDDDDQKSNSDWSDASRSDQLSLTIEEYIEEVTTTLDASENEGSDLSDFETSNNRRIPFPEAGRIVVDGTEPENSDVEEKSSATELFTSTSSWEENWLFQKKRLRSTPNAHHPVPVPMLVPNPSEDYRALVGGVDADDLSDISDCSDLILEDPNPEKKALFRLSTSQCNKSTEELDENENQKDEESSEKETIKESLSNVVEESNSIFSQVNLRGNGNVTLTAAALEAENEFREETIENVKLNSNFVSPSQKDREFSVEDFHLLQQCESSSWNESSVGVTLTFTENENSGIRSRIAEREKEKWSNPVPLTDNPYSLENIKKRAQRKKNDFFQIGTYTGESIDFPEDFSSDELTKSSENLRFSRDYYINGSKNPSGKSSSPESRLSKGFDQKYLTNEKNETSQDTETLMMQEKNDETSITRKTNKKEFSLPNVKELAKQFISQDARKTEGIRNELGNKLENKQTARTLKSGTPGREPELDYSTIPVSEIVFNLQQSKQSQVKAKKHVPYVNIRPKTKIEICRKTNTDDHEKIGAVRYNGKQVHSLTARSISKEFREGLKNHSYQNVFLKINRAAGSGENERKDIVNSVQQTSFTPPIDLKNMKRFWEEIISANATATKQK